MRSKAQGVTLLELMTALAVLAIVVGIGVPAFSSIARNNAIAAQTSGIMQALTIARSESVKRGARVSVCAAADSDGDECREEDEPDWSSGWIVFEDDFGDIGMIDESDVIIQTWGPIVNGVNVATDAASVTFTRTGRAEFAEEFTLTKAGCSKDQQREIDVGISGRVSMQRTDCPTE